MKFIVLIKPKAQYREGRVTFVAVVDAASAKEAATMAKAHFTPDGDYLQPTALPIEVSAMYLRV